jgi:arylformamidase
MKIYDISQEVFSCEVYPGDPVPERRRICSIENGDLYNLTAFSMCAHNGTHADAPCHFIKDGDTIEKIDINKTVGWAFVYACEGDIGAEEAEKILALAASEAPEAAKRILIKGKATVTSAAASVFAEAGVYLIGVESQSVGPEDAPMEVHKILLGAGTVLLEGLRLSEADSGVYLLSSAPLLLAGADGAPCRAVLIKF